jgi:ABC-type multidrug transport system ATPase subunit
MEECEALCDKLSIMINGQLQCFDSISMLKKKFGEGLRLIIKCKHSVDYKTDQIIANLENFIFNNFPTATLEDKQYETLFYNIRSSFNSPQDTTSLSSDSTLMNRDHVENLSQIFAKIEENKEKLNIESYYLSETTLEQVFMSFANKSKKIINEKNQRESKLSQFKNKAPFSIISQKMFNLSDDGSNLNNKSSEDDAHLISYKSIGQFNDNFIDLPVKSEYQF